MMQQKKKKILILIDWFAPGFKAGGPIQSCVNLCIALKGQFDIYVLTTDTDHGDNEPYGTVLTNQWVTDPKSGVQVYYAQKKQFSFKQLSTEIKAVAANFVYLNSMFSPRFVLYPLWMLFRGELTGKLVLCPRGTLYDSAVSLKSYKKKPLLVLYKWMGIAKKVLFHATNEREKKAILHYFPGSKIVIADNLPNTIQPVYTPLVKEPGSLRCIFIARIVAIKNLLFLLNLLKNVQGKVHLTVAGPAEDEAYLQKCKAVAATMPGNITVQFVGAIRNEALPSLLQAHHLFVLPTSGENFGHSIFEAFLAGRPVLISDQTPWLQLQKSHIGWDLPLKEPGNFADVIDEMAQYNQQQFDAYAKNARDFAQHFISDPLLIEPYNHLFS